MVWYDIEWYEIHNDDTEWYIMILKDTEWYTVQIEGMLCEL